MAPFPLAAQAHDAAIVADAEGARIWVAWAESGTSALVYAYVEAAGAVALGGMLGVVDEALPHYHVVQRVGASTIAIWLDVAQSRTLSATRMCR